MELIMMNSDNSVINLFFPESLAESCTRRRAGKLVSMFLLPGKVVLYGSYAFLILSHLLVDSADALRTTVPDEIIQIVRNRSYNRYHLPSQAETLSRRTPFRKIMGDGNAWNMILDYHPLESKNTISVIQRDGDQRIGKITFGFRSAKSFHEHLEKVRQQYESFGFVENAHTPDEHTLLAFSFGDRAVQQYNAVLLLSKTGVSLRVKQNKTTKQQKMEIPSEYFEDVQEAFTDVLDRIYNSTTGGILDAEYATNVTIGIYIEGMSSFRAQSMDFHVDIYLSETWEDFRLQHTSDEPVLVKDINLYEELWHPDLYFANAKEAKFHDVTAPNFLLWIYPNGSLYLDTRVSLVVNCMMDLAHYPLDAQECYIRILSYAYDIDNLNVSWREGDPITLNSAIRLPDMNLVNFKALSCTPIIYATGKWACIYASFKMQREIMHHVLQSYIPSGLIVIISWFSFWLDVDAVPGRVSLCITTLLTLATQSSAARMALPQVSYAKAIDVWMGTCMAFVFGVMIEFTAVNYLSRRKLSPGFHPSEQSSRAESPHLNGGPLKRRKTENRKSGNVEFHNLLFDPSDCECRARHGSFGGVPGSPNKEERLREKPKQEEETPFHLQQAKRKQLNRRLAMGVDKACRVLFPVVFLLFNAMYWAYYLNATGTTEGVVEE